MENFWLILSHLMWERNWLHGLLSSTIQHTIWYAWCVFLNTVFPGVGFLILLMSTAVLDLKFIISQLKKEMFPPWLIAVTWLNSWDNVSAVDTGRFYSKCGVSAGYDEEVDELITSHVWGWWRGIQNEWIMFHASPVTLKNIILSLVPVCRPYCSCHLETWHN